MIVLNNNEDLANNEAVTNTKENCKPVSQIRLLPFINQRWCIDTVWILLLLNFNYETKYKSSGARVESTLFKAKKGGCAREACSFTKKELSLLNFF